MILNIIKTHFAKSPASRVFYELLEIKIGVFLGFEKCIVKSEQKEIKGMKILLMNGRKRNVFGLLVFCLFVKILHIYLLTLYSYFEKSF